MDEVERVSAMTSVVSNAYDLASSGVIVFWGLFGALCSSQPASPWDEVATTALQQQIDEMDSAGSGGDAGSLRASFETSFDAPADPGLSLELTPYIQDEIAVVTIKVSGWVTQRSDGRAFGGLLVSWSDGWYNHLNETSDKACIPSGAQWVNVDETYYVTHEFNAPGDYDMGVVTVYCAADGEWELAQANIAGMPMGH